MSAKVFIEDGPDNWVEIKRMTEFKLPNYVFKPLNCLSVNIVPDDHDVLNLGYLFEDRELGWAGYYNFFCSRSEWENSGGE